MPRFSALPLRRQLLIAILLLLLPVMAGTIWSAFGTYRDSVAELQEESRVMALVAAAWLDRDLGTLDRQAAGLTAIQAVQRLDPVVAARVLRNALPTGSNVADILLLRADGFLVARAVEAPNAIDPGVEWVRQVVEHDRRVLVPVGRGAPTHILLAHAVHDATGDAVGALALLVGLETVQTAFATLPLSAGSVVAVVDQSGRILARTHEGDRYVGKVVPISMPLAARPPGEWEGPDGVRRMYGEAVVEQAPWLVRAGIPMSVATTNAMSLWTRGFALLGLGIAGWLIVALVLSRRLSDSVNHLDATAQRIADGDFGPMTHQPMVSREFTELQDAFDRMLQRFNATRDTLDAQMSQERRIRQELESLQGQVIRQERLAAVGQLVSGVAHEINNPLQAILGFAELLQMQADVPEDVKSDLRLIQKESARACGIIRNLALFARQQPAEAAPIQLIEVVTAVAELRQRRLESEDIRLEVDDRSTQYVMAVTTELQQVVLNFVINAEQAILATGGAGRITIRTYDEDGQVVLEAEDTGPGVPPEHEAKLFQPFFTTKSVGQGTGLGLSVSYGIIDSLRGQIGYRRSASGGSIFYFTLPAVSESFEEIVAGA
jgi:signal transduction histidine kinase